MNYCEQFPFIFVKLWYSLLKLLFYSIEYTPSVFMRLSEKHFKLQDSGK